MHLFLAVVILGGVAMEECTPQEVAFYESQGWDSWECHLDKNAPEELCPDGSTPDPYAADANRDACTLEPFPDEETAK